MTAQENLRIALDGGVPESLPCFFVGSQIMTSSVIQNLPPLGQKEGYDWWGVHWTASDSASGNYSPTVGVPYLLTDITKWREQVKFPDISGIDWEAVAAKDTQRIDRNNVTIFMGFYNGIFERIHFLMGFEETMMALMEEPEAVAELANAIADFYVELVDKIGQYYKPEYFTLLDDYTHKTGSFMSPATFDEVFAPALKKVVDAVTRNGMKYIQHCCGREELLLDNFYNIGIRRVDPCQPCNDVVAMRQRHPDMAFIGGLDVQGVFEVPGVTEEQLRAEVRRCAKEYGHMGGYVLYGATTCMHNPAAYAPGGIMNTLITEAVKCGMEGL